MLWWALCTDVDARRESYQDRTISRGQEGREPALVVAEARAATSERMEKFLEAGYPRPGECR